MSVPVVDDCAEVSYQDRTAPAAERTLAWDFPFAGSVDRCIIVRVGQSVRWDGNFAMHPLENDQGSTPNPIGAHDASGVVTFTAPGIYGYRCNYHFEMRGAVQVVAAPAAVPGSGLGVRLGAPVLLLLVGLGVLGWLGLFSARDMWRFNKYALVLAAVGGAVLTPGSDIYSQLMLAGPLYVLYNLSIVIVWTIEKHRTAEPDVDSPLLLALAAWPAIRGRLNRGFLSLSSRARGRAA